MESVFLIGGGGDHPERAETYGRFVAAATRAGVCRIALVLVGETAADNDSNLAAMRPLFAAAGLPEGDLYPVLLLPGDSLSADRLSALEPSGVFVGGGLTPLYQEVLCRDRRWVGYMQTAGIPYGGLSAGAAIAATTAIVGGWQAERAGIVRPILYQGASEDRDLLDVRPGLGLVPFAVEVHASQWGTLTRLLHALDLGLVAEGWAVDEHTLLQVDNTGVHVYGAGQAYHVHPEAKGNSEVGVSVPI
jgi:cyanophycinase